MNHDKRQIKADKEEVSKYIQEPLLNNENNIKALNFDKPSKNRNNNEDEKFLFEDDEIIDVASNFNLTFNENEINKKRIIQEEKIINNSLSLEQNTEKRKKDILIHGKRNYDNLGNIYYKFNPSIKLDDNYIYLAGDSYFLCSDDFSSSDSKDILFVKNLKSLFLNFISKYFS